MSALIQTQVLVIGSGPAGNTAALYAVRAGLECLVIHGPEPGGQLMTTTDVENFPGFAQGILGPDLIRQMQDQVRHCGGTFESDVITHLDLSKSPFEAYGRKSYRCQAMIIAKGARAKWLGLDSEGHYKGFGVSACAVCDGFFFKNRTVAVIGGGNTAVEEALFMARHASKVFLIHRRDRLRAEKILQNRLFAEPKISVLWDHAVEEIMGQDQPHKMVTGLRLINVHTQEQKIIDLQGIFIAIGHHPNAELVKDWLPLDRHGYVDVAMGQTATAIPGVFVAGDVRDRIYRQAVTAAGQGCMAALEAERFLMMRSF